MIFDLDSFLAGFGIATLLYFSYNLAHFVYDSSEED